MTEIKEKLIESEEEKEKLAKAFFETSEINKKLKEILAQKDQIVDKLTAEIEKVHGIKAEFEPILNENNQIKKQLAEKEKEVEDLKEGFEKATSILGMLPELQKHLKESQDSIERSAEDNQNLVNELEASRKLEEEMKGLLDKFQNICQVLTEENKSLKSQIEQSSGIANKVGELEVRYKKEIGSLLKEVKSKQIEVEKLESENKQLIVLVEQLKKQNAIEKKQETPRNESLRLETSNNQNLANEIVSGIILGLKEMKKEEKASELEVLQSGRARESEIMSEASGVRVSAPVQASGLPKNLKPSFKKVKKNTKPSRRGDYDEEEDARRMEESSDSRENEVTKPSLRVSARKKKTSKNQANSGLETFLCNQIERLSSDLQKERVLRENLLESRTMIKSPVYQEAPGPFLTYSHYRPSFYETRSPDIESFETNKVEYSMKQAFLDFEQKMKNLKRRIELC